MFQREINKGGAQVMISANDAQGPFTSRLYVNYGETATATARKAKTLKGAERQAKKMIAEHLGL